MQNYWNVWGVSIKGKSHKKHKLPNQDAWAFKKTKDYVILVVSDGLGSKSNSDIGSKAACKAVIKAIKYCQRKQVISVNTLIAFINAFWLSLIEPLEANNCAATCLFAVIKKQKIILGRLGDGVIIAAGNESCVILEDTEKDFCNMTNCLDGNMNYNDWEIIEKNTEDFHSILICTDGIANFIIPETRKEFAVEISNEYKNINKTLRRKDLVKWLEKWGGPQNKDDKTLTCLYKESAPNE